jgi:hypothetical protein
MLLKREQPMNFSADLNLLQTGCFPFQQHIISSSSIIILFFLLIEELKNA